LREERRLRVFENRVLRRIFGPKRDEVTENYIMRRFMICTAHHMLLWWSNQNIEMGEARSTYRRV
jgi:hypothetical protein